MTSEVQHAHDHAPNAASRPAVLFALLAAFAVAPFAPAIPGAFLWDDTLIVSANPHLREPDYFAQAVRHPFPYAVWDSTVDALPGMYRPVVSIAYGVEYRAFGTNPLGYHLVNIALHVACVFLAFFWLRRRIGIGGFHSSMAAAAGALVFAVHPSRVESVAWISGCTDLWMALWVLLGLTAWDCIEGVSGAMLAGAVFILAELSKELAVAVPIALALDSWVPHPRVGRQRRARIAWVVALPLVAFGRRVLSFPLGSHQGLHESAAGIFKHVVAAVGGYTRIILFPWPASTQTGYLDPRNPVGYYPPTSLAVGVCFVAGFAALAFMAWRTPRLRPWLADLQWYALLILPVVVSINDAYYLNERHLYLPLLGVAAMLTRFLATGSVALSNAWFAAVGVLVALYVAGTAKHSAHFLSADALWSYEVQLRPEDAQALESLKTVRMEQGRYVDAKTLAVRTLKAMGGARPRWQIFDNWLQADFRDTQSNDSRLSAARAVHDRIAAGQGPDGPARDVYDLLRDTDRSKLRESREFQIRHARLLWATGDSAGSIGLLESVEKSPHISADPDAVVPLVTELVANGSVVEAARVLAHASPSTDPGRKKVTRLVSAVQSLPAGSAPQLAAALIAADAPFEAFEVMRRIPRSAETEDELANRIVIEITLRRYSEATADIERLRRIAANRADQFSQIVHSMLEEDQASSDSRPP